MTAEISSGTLAGNATSVNPLRVTADRFIFSIVDAGAIARIDGAQWDDLAKSVVTENPFYSRQYMLAGLETLDRDAGIKAMLVHSDSGRLVGLFPFRQRLKLNLPFAPADGATNLYQFNGAPLVHADHGQAIIAQWFAAMGKGIPALWSFQNFDTQSALARLIEQQALAHGTMMQAVNFYERHCVKVDPAGFEAHLKSVLSSKSLGDLRRKIRKLEGLGTLRFEQEREPAAMRARFEDFLTLEHSGWKRDEGTSFLSQPEHAKFARLAFAGVPGREGLGQTNTLLLDGKPIAMKIFIRSGTVPFIPKIAFDEELRKNSPGMVHDYMMVEAFYGATNDLSEIDSARTVVNDAGADLWNTEKHMATVVVGSNPTHVKALASLYSSARRAKEQLKLWIKQVRERKSAPKLATPKPQA